MPNEVVIPGRFSKALDEHLVFSYCGVVEWPLIFGVFGRPGDGKSFQIRTHLERRGVTPVTLNAADLESDRAGAPGKLVLDIYKDAGDRIDEGTLAAVVVDDFDTTVGEWANSTTTVNHQQVLAQLMHLADSPTVAAGKRLRRAPVIITGNDLSKIYPPLRRPGRMRAFPWIPTAEERTEIVAAVFRELLNEDEVGAVLARVSEAPIAFFSDLFVEILATTSAPEVARMAEGMSGLVSQGVAARASLEKYLKDHPLSGAQIEELASEVWRERELATRSHLAE